MKNHTGELFSHLGIKWLRCFIHQISVVNAFLKDNSFKEKGDNYLVYKLWSIVFE